MKKNKFLPFAKPSIGEDEINEVIDTLKSGWLSIGPKTQKFEKKLEDYIGCNYVVALNSCTAALHLSLLGLDIGKNDEVITTPFTFAATANTIINVGAKPVFADIRADTYNINPDEIVKKITSKTRAIIPVHYGGQPCEMDEIIKIAKEHDLYVIEDAAHAIGAKYKNKKIGTIGDVTCFSFYAIKNITTGDGGAIATNNKKLSEKIRKLSLHGINKNAWNRYSSKGNWYYEVEYPGYKYNLTDIQSAIGLVQLPKLDNFIERRREISEMYNHGFEKNDAITTPFTSKDVYHAKHLYPILVNGLNINRNDFIEELKEMNIGTSVHFIPMHYHPFYKKTFKYKKGDFPITENVFKNLISLPLYPDMSNANVNYVIKCVKKIANKNR